MIKNVHPHNYKHLEVIDNCKWTTPFFHVLQMIQENMPSYNFVKFNCHNVVANGQISKGCRGLETLISFHLYTMVNPLRIG